MYDGSSSGPDDAELVRRVREGDQRAFDEIVARYRGLIFALAMTFVHNHADAEEVAQDTFIRAYRGLANFRGDSSLKTWLHKIAVNLARNRYWYHRRRKKHMTVSLDCPLSEEGEGTFAELHATAEPGPSDQVVHEELERITAEMMERLKPSHREVLILRNDLHKDYNEIAAELGLNVGTVKSRIARARGELWSRITARCPALGGM